MNLKRRYEGKGQTGQSEKMIAGRVVFSGRCNRCFHNQMIVRRLPAGNTAGRNKKMNPMKKILIISGFVIAILFGSFQKSNAVCSAPSGIIIDFSSKAYWDGPSQSCLPRDKGCCFHISVSIGILSPGIIHGTLDQSRDGALTFSFSKSTGVLSSTLMDFCKRGMFVLDGTGTFSDEILKKLGLPSGFKLPSGQYPYVENGDVVTVTLK